MLQIIPRWQVDVTLSNGKHQAFWISDSHIANVLRQVAMMSFSVDLAVDIASVRVSAHEPAQRNNPVTSFTVSGQS